MTVNANKETLGFETEVKQLMHLVIHSLYSNQEIFLRELISNSSDALDKLRFSGLSKGDLYEDDSDLKINLSFDAKKKTITIIDNGIGMNREDVISHLGTVAKSGTKEFLGQLTGDQTKDSNLIGEFGVGFYSSFIVADSVTVKSRKAGESHENGVLWSSTGDGSYTVESIDKLVRGTEVTLHLKKEATDFLSDWRLKNVISKYSDHICWPIVMEKIIEAQTDKENEDSTETVEPTVEFETINKAKALWTLSKGDLKDEDYQEFYKHIAHDFQDPLLWSHNQVEGKHEYTTLLYIPSHAPFDMWNQENKHGLKLYVKRVFIMDDADQFLPRYLRFVKGIVDSNDLPLNVSREILQDNKLINTIKSASVKRILSTLEKLSNNDSEKYNKFWDEFGLVLKEGVIEDLVNKEKIAKLLRFSTTHDDSSVPRISLDDYISRMQEGQDKIYYITATTFNSAKSSPHLELCRKKGYEVLLLSDKVDEWLVNHLSEFDSKKLQSVTKGQLDIDDSDEDNQEQKEQDDKEYSSLLKQIKEVLGDSVKEVQLTYRLTDSPTCVIADENDMGMEMQRILQAAGQDVPVIKPILEVNPHHALIEKLNQETDDERFAQWSHLLLDQAILAEGGNLTDPALFVSRMNQMLLDLVK